MRIRLMIFFVLFLLCLSANLLLNAGVQGMWLDVVGKQTPVISETMTNKIISASYAAIKASKQWADFEPRKRVWVSYECGGFRHHTNAVWRVEFSNSKLPPLSLGGGVEVLLDANSFKVLCVLGTK